MTPNNPIDPSTPQAAVGPPKGADPGGANKKGTSPAKPPPAHAPPPGSGAAALIDRLRSVRAEVQDLHKLLDHVRAGKATVAANASYIAGTRDEVDALLQQVEGDDIVRHITNNWQQMKASPILAKPDAYQNVDPQDQLHHLDILAGQVQDLVLQVGIATIPARVNDWLQQARPGYYVPFHLVFEDELPRVEDRQRVLNHLKYAPNVVEGGLVDATNGLIYRYNTEASERWRSYGLLLAGIAISIVVVVAGARWAPIPGWAEEANPPAILLAAWAAALLGTLVHIAVSRIKAAQMRGGLPPIFAPSELPLVLDAYTGQILQKLVWVILALFGLAFTLGGSGVTVINAFLVGYSVDSFVELFGSSIERQTQAQLGSLKRQLGVSGA